MRIKAAIFFLGFVFSLPLTAQLNNQDSTRLTKEEKKKIYSSPRKASIMSAIVPGLGQAYNRKYWKVPVIYAGLGVSSYFFYTNNGWYNDYRRALRAAAAIGGPGNAVVDGVLYTTEDLKTQKVFYRKRRDFAGMAIGIIYLLNIIDANVDAHLKTFDVSDDLSLRLMPWQGYGLNNHLYNGLSLTMTFRK